MTSSTATVERAWKTMADATRPARSRLREATSERARADDWEDEEADAARDGVGREPVVDVSGSGERPWSFE